MVESLGISEIVDNVQLTDMSLGTGVANIDIEAKEGLFNQVLSEYAVEFICGSTDKKIWHYL